MIPSCVVLRKLYILVGVCTFFGLISLSLLSRCLASGWDAACAKPGQNISRWLWANGQSTENEVYATLLTGQRPETSEAIDHYYNATRILVHKLLRDPLTRDSRPVVVFVTPDVVQWKRQQLRMDGAIVRQIRNLSFIDAIGGLTPEWMTKSDPAVLQNGGARESRWKDQFTKLQLLGMTEYNKIIYLDSDLLILRYIGDLFHSTPPISRFSVISNPEYRKRSFDVLIDEDPSLPNNAPHPRHPERFVENIMSYGFPESGLYPYTFYAVSDPGGSRLRQFGPPRTSKLLNAGMLVFKPSRAHHARIMRLARDPKWWNYGRLMEQDLLRLAFHKSGNFPFATLDWRYNTLWAKKEDLARNTKTIHGKLWAAGGGVDKELIELYQQSIKDVSDYWGTAQRQ